MHYEFLFFYTKQNIRETKEYQRLVTIIETIILSSASRQSIGRNIEGVKHNRCSSYRSPVSVSYYRLTFYFQSTSNGFFFSIRPSPSGLQYLGIGTQIKKKTEVFSLIMHKKKKTCNFKRLKLQSIPSLWRKRGECLSDLINLLF